MCIFILLRPNTFSKGADGQSVCAKTGLPSLPLYLHNATLSHHSPLITTMRGTVMPRSVRSKREPAVYSCLTVCRSSLGQPESRDTRWNKLGLMKLVNQPQSPSGGSEQNWDVTVFSPWGWGSLQTSKKIQT